MGLAQGFYASTGCYKHTTESAVKVNHTRVTVIRLCFDSCDVNISKNKVDSIGKWMQTASNREKLQQIKASTDKKKLQLINTKTANQVV